MDVELPILIGTLAVVVPIDIPEVVSLVSKSILSVPVTVSNPLGLFVPIPTFPSTIKPFAGASLLPEYVDPIVSPPSISTLLFGLSVPIPNFPALVILICSVSLILNVIF